MTPQQLLTRGGWDRTQAPGPDAERREPRGSCRRGLEARAAARAVEVSPESGRHTPPKPETRTWARRAAGRALHAPHRGHLRGPPPPGSLWGSRPQVTSSGRLPVQGPAACSLTATPASAAPGSPPPGARTLGGQRRPCPSSPPCLSPVPRAPRANGSDSPLVNRLSGHR